MVTIVEINVSLLLFRIYFGFVLNLHIVFFSVIDSLMAVLESNIQLQFL